MKTPIYDFLKDYSQSDVSRFHMPGHKGLGHLGCEQLDITEIGGADVLCSASGIIAESEKNASTLFGSAHTFYSTEGSTLCVKAMLALATTGQHNGKRPHVLAARNVHKAFVYACALLDLDVSWLYPHEADHLCACKISASEVRNALENTEQKPCAVYLTSPDYLGNIADVKGIAEVCDEYGIPLLVDNAHGAYLKFLNHSLHPIDLGASMCCDSAHKTLPVLTGGAYLHIAKKAAHLAERARSTLALFASTSPSYLTLASLDACNAYILGGYSDKLESLTKKLEKTKHTLNAMGIESCGDEPLKLTLRPCRIGYTGTELSEHLRKHKVECEFADGEYVVLMASPQNTDTDLERIISAFESLAKKAPVEITRIKPAVAERAMTIREAIFSDSETISVTDACGRVCASPTVSCPPAVPIAVSGEIINETTVRIFESYGINSIEVTK